MAFLGPLTADADNDTRARLDEFIRWSCIGCGHQWPPKSAPPSYCRQCGMQGGYAPEDLPLHGHHSSQVGPIAPGVIIPEWAAGFPRGLPRGLSMVARGRPGSGKSRAIFRLASQMGRAAILGLEMGSELSKATAASAGADLDRCWWYDEPSVLEDLEILAPDVVVVDSIQELGRRRKSIVASLQKWAKDCGTNVLLISQLGQHGASRHGENDDFKCDIVIDILPGHSEDGPRTASHGLGHTKQHCADGCAHVRIAKSRICPLIGFDVPIVAT